MLTFVLTPGNVHDRKPVMDLSKNLFGKLAGDRGYISKKLGEELLQKGIQLITKTKRNMRNKLMSLYDKMLLQKRGVVDSVICRLKYGPQIEHTRHRSPVNFVANLLSGLVAYSLLPKKPNIRMHKNEAIELKA